MTMMTLAVMLMHYEVVHDALKMMATCYGGVGVGAVAAICGCAFGIDRRLKGEFRFRKGS